MRKCNLPWDQRFARYLVRPLAKTPITPNQLTLITVLVAFSGAGFLATGDRDYADIGAGLFVFARFLDHFDGELARLKMMTSKFGYYLDYAAGASSYAALFFGLGIGLRDGFLQDWSIFLGLMGASAAMVGAVSNIAMDRSVGNDETGDAIGYPGFAGFELEDGIYLLAPITWLGFLEPFFFAAAIGATVYGLWTLVQWYRLKL